MTPVRRLIPALAVVLAVATAPEASAQQAPPPQTPPQDPGDPIRVLSERPYRGLFGGGVSAMEQLLTLGVNFGGGVDSSVLVDERDDPNAEVPLRREQSGFANGSATIGYALSRDAISFSAGGGGSLTYYPNIGSQYVHSYFANAGASWRLTDATSVSSNYSVSYEPLQRLASLPGGIPTSLGPTNPFDGTIGAQSESYRSENANVGIAHRLSRRVGTNFGYSVWRSTSPDGATDSSNQGVSARVTVALTRDVAFYTGYQLYQSDFPDEVGMPGYRSQNADFGLNFAKALSLTRKTTMSFGTGTVGVTDGNETRYSLTGNVNVMRELARSWSTSFAYTRDAQFVQAFQQPVISDAMNASVQGMVSRRVRFNAGTGIAFGKVGFSDDDSGYRAIYASTGLNVAINRFLSGGVRYSYSRYRFDDAVPVPINLIFQSGRHGVNVSLSTWLPLLSRTRRN